MLETTLASEPAYRRRQVWEWAARGASSYAEMTNLPSALRVRLEADVPFSSLALVQEARSRDGTVKALFRTGEGHPVEAVLMRYRDGRRSVCVSSQSGCPLTCTFCATGQMGFRRNLTVFEIAGQAAIELNVVGDSIEARVAKRLARSPEWAMHTLKSSADVRKLLDDLKRRVANWAEDRD